jgi:hypothetical protein
MLTFVAEGLWTGVLDNDVLGLDGRAELSGAEMVDAGGGPCS